jgi:predicted enzyme related to lactoylglutathione lyase
LAAFIARQNGSGIVHEQSMTTSTDRLAGVELYFDNLDAAKEFYAHALGLRLDEDYPDHHAKLGIGDRFICLERK